MEACTALQQVKTSWNLIADIRKQEAISNLQNLEKENLVYSKKSH